MKEFPEPGLRIRVMEAAAHAWREFRRLSRMTYTYRFWVYLMHQWHEQFTRPGRWVIVAGLATAVAGGFPEAMVGSIGFSSFAALIFLSAIVSLVRKPPVTVSRRISDRCVAGAETTVHITVRNTTKHDLHDIGAYEFRVPEAMEPIDPIRYEAVIPAGESKVFSYRMRALRRGRYILPGPTAVSAFPFGLTQSKRFHAQPQPLIVYPAFHRLVHADVPAGLRHQPGGIVLTSHIGESMEFIGNREYRPGDRLRDLHPRSWARVGYPVVKQFQEEFLTRIAVLVDTYPPPWLSRRGLPSPASRSLEAVLSMAAGISDYLARQEYIVDLFAAGPELYHFQAGRSLGYLDNILDILACIEACKDDALDVVGARFTEEVGRMSTVIMVLMDWDEKREALVRRVESMGVSVKPIVVSSRHELSDLMGIGTAARVVTPEQVEAGLEQI